MAGPGIFSRGSGAPSASAASLVVCRLSSAHCGTSPAPSHSHAENIASSFVFWWKSGRVA